MCCYALLSMISSVANFQEGCALNMTWELLPHFLLRSTGFSYEWIDRLAFQETVKSLDELLDIEEAIATARAELQKAIRNGELSSTSRVLMRQMESALLRKSLVKQVDELAPQIDSPLRQVLEHWNRLLVRYQQHEVAARAIFARELPKRRRSLYNYAQDRRFQEAIWLSSPQMYEYGLLAYLEQWSADRRPSDIRRIERQLVSYLQRFCVKNDTASFFGPINYGDFAPSASPITPGAGSVQQRRTFMAYWGVAALAEIIEQDGAIHPYLCPRLHPLCRIDITTNRVRIGNKTELALTTQQHKILQSIDGRSTLLQLAIRLALPLEELLAETNFLKKLHIIVVRLEVPVTALDALEWLVAWIHALPPECVTREYWGKVVDHCQEFQNQFTTASFADRRNILRQLEAWFAEIIGRSARRDEGQLYADRLLLYEECYGSMGVLSLGEDCLVTLQSQLAPVLDLYAAHACVLHQALQAQGVQTLVELSGNSEGRMPLLTFLQKQQQPNALPESSMWQQALLHLVTEHADEHVVAIDMACLPRLDRAAFDASPLIASPDVMLIARNEDALRAGDFTLVLAECHDTLMVWGWGLYFHPDRKEVEAAGGRLLRKLAHGGSVCANVLPSKRAKIIPFEYPGPTIEMLAASEKAVEECIPMAVVQAEVCEGRPFLHAPGYPLLRLYNGELSSFAHNIFALPCIHPLRIELPAHTPRITIGKAVFQREQWRFTRKQLLPGKYPGVSFELMLDMHRAARCHGLPRHLFLRVPGERKPVFIDRYNYFLLELLQYLMPAETEFVLQEMLPAPDELWLRNAHGTFCAELRLSVGYSAIPEGESHDRC